MSTEQPIDPQAIEETKRQIRSLVSEIASLTRQDVEPVVYYAEFLQKVVTALAAEGGAIWTTRKDGGLELAYQINIRAAFADEAGEDRTRHAKLLYHVLRNGEHMLVPPYSGAGGDDSAGNPTSYLLVVAPIFDEETPVGVVEIFQRATSGPASQRGYMKFLLEMCQHMGDFLQNRKLKELASYKTLSTQVERFSRTVHESLDPITTAYTIANEGRRLIGCDRVSVALRKGRKCIIKAVSGQDTMDTRANSVLLLGKLSTAVMRSGEALWYTGDSSDLPPQIEEAVHDYVDETHTKTVAVLPLMKPSDYVPDGDEAKRLQEEKEEVIGCIVVEQIEDSRPQAEFAEGVELVTEHSSLALSNAVEHNSLFLMPVWRALGNAAWVLKARTLPKTLAVAALVLIAIAALFLFPWHFRMKASGALQPVQRKMVFSNASGQRSQRHSKKR
jgi:GAF domain-containing protein